MKLWYDKPPKMTQATPLTEETVLVQCEHRKAHMKLRDLLDTINLGGCEFSLHRVSSGYYDLTVFGPNDMMSFEVTIEG